MDIASVKTGQKFYINSDFTPPQHKDFMINEFF